MNGIKAPGKARYLWQTLGVNGAEFLPLITSEHPDIHHFQCAIHAAATGKGLRVRTRKAIQDGILGIFVEQVGAR